MAVYTPNEPIATRTLSSSQPIIKNNFTLLNTYYGLDHYAFDDVSALKGLHKYIHLPNAPAVPVTTATQGALYCKAIGAISALYFRRESAGAEIQMTSSVVPSWSVAGTTGQGCSFLPGNILIQYGYIRVASGATNTITYPRAFSGGFAAYSIQVSMEKTSASSTVGVYVDEGSSTDTTFKVFHTSSNTHYVYWTAIGPA